jgi:hypothetical protein
MVFPSIFSPLAWIFHEIFRLESEGLEIVDTTRYFAAVFTAICRMTKISSYLSLLQISAETRVTVLYVSTSCDRVAEGLDSQHIIASLWSGKQEYV